MLCVRFENFDRREQATEEMLSSTFFSLCNAKTQNGAEVECAKTFNIY